MKKLESLNSEKFKVLSDGKLNKIKGGKEVTRVQYIKGKAVDCSEDYGAEYACFARFTETLVYNQNIFGKITKVISHTMERDGTIVEAI